MGAPSTSEESQAVLAMARPCPWPEWLLLELPDGRWGAFWRQGLGGEHATAVARGDYSACSEVFQARDKALQHMAANSLQNEA